MRSIPVSENLFQGNFDCKKYVQRYTFRYSETSYGSSERVAFDCKKYVQHDMLRYSEKLRFPRFDRKLVRPDPVEAGAPRSATSGALRTNFVCLIVT